MSKKRKSVFENKKCKCGCGQLLPKKYRGRTGVLKGHGKK